MQLKDYYNILELPPSATVTEIKKAYRRLAHIYHPDKKNNDPYAAARFAEIREAYETLVNPLKKEFYLQQRWYAQSTGQKFKQEPANPVAILKQVLELERYVARLDAHRLYHQGLFDRINSILSDENLQTLHYFNETDTNEEIVRAVLKAGNGLSYRFIPALGERLKKLAPPDESTVARIEQFIRHHRRTHYWEKNKVWLVLLIVSAICLVIFLSAK